jgi:ATP-dependent DNA helicase RecQ
MICKPRLSLPLIAKKSKHTENQVLAVLHKLKKDIVDYQSKNNDASLVFNEIRKMKEPSPEFPNI